MALRTLMLNKKLSDKRKAQQGLETRKAVFAKREEELAAAIEEAETEAEKAAVEEAVEALEAEEKEVKEQLQTIEAEITQLVADIEEAEEAAAEAVEEITGEPAEEPAEEETGERSRRRGKEKRSMPNIIMTREQAAAFQRSQRHTYKDAPMFVRAVIKTSSTGVVGPTGVGGINDNLNHVSSLLDMVKITDCTGMSTYKVAFVNADPTAVAITEGSAPSESEPTFGSVTLSPSNLGVVSYVSKEIRKQSPLTYEDKVRTESTNALRRALNTKIVTKALASAQADSYTITISGAAGSAAFTSSLLSDIILAYGGDESVDGAACLFLTKADLRAFAAVRGTNEFLPVYSIVPDETNPSTGIIKDNNGLSCRYCLSKDLTALSSATISTTATKHMMYGNPQCIELAMWGGVDVETSEGYKFAEGLITVRGETSADCEVTVKNGLLVVSCKKSA